MKLAVMKRADFLPDNFHYFLHPIAMVNDAEAEMFRLMGYIIIEVADDEGQALLESSRKALGHQLNIAQLAEEVGK